MIITLRITYHSNWGEKLFVTGNHEYLGGGDPKLALPMRWKGNGIWEAHLDLEKLGDEFAYQYFLLNESSQTLIREKGPWRNVKIETDLKTTLIKDEWWYPGTQEEALQKKAFSKTIFKPSAYQSSFQGDQHKKGICSVFSVRTPRAHPELAVGLIGSSDSLGAWDPSAYIPMSSMDGINWELEIFLPREEEDLIEYKFILFDRGTSEIIQWEGEKNRIAYTEEGDEYERIWFRSTDFNYSRNWKGGGVAIPVFSLRSETGFGVGEFTDLIKLIDWAELCGMQLVQVLPINDTTATKSWKDSYPYGAISVFALHPLYINLDSVCKFYGLSLPSRFAKLRDKLNISPEVEYDQVINHKLTFAKGFYNTHKDKILADKDFQKFVDQEASWLTPYACFSYLRDTFETADFFRWGKFSQYSKALTEALCNPDSPDFPKVAVYFFLQYHLHLQLSEAVEYGREKGIALKGDIPIGIYRYSVDAWVAPELYNMDAQSGAPPDFFSTKGQNWGFPTYNWEEMEKDGFEWWRQRLRHMARYFDAYRIDHILGFFRIWEIPYQSMEGMMGAFNPGLPYLPQEIMDWGIPFNEERFTKPYLREHILQERLGERAAWVKEHILEFRAVDQWSFKAGVDNQRAIDYWLNSREELSEEEKQQLKDAIFSLLGEVIFLPDQRSQEAVWHPRFGMQFTQSFRELDHWIQQRLNALYNDYFFRRHEEFWAEKARIKLAAILDATDMLVCGEDLGFVPAAVPGIMDEFGMLSLEIQRMPKQNDREFFHPHDAPYLSVVSPSSHDISPLRAWWEEDRQRTQSFYNHILGQGGEAPYFCESWIVRMIIHQHLFSPAMWAIFPIQDLLALDEELKREIPQDEQINNPANANHYWRFRLHISLETLLNESSFNQSIKEMLNLSGRLNKV